MSISLETIRRQGQEGKFRDPALMRTGYVIHRKISPYITYLLLRLFPSVCATTVTVVAFMVSLIGAVLLSQWGSGWFFVGIAFLYFGFLLDKVDGEIARVRQVFSARGVFLDDMMHFVVPAFCFVCFFFDALWSGGLHAVCVLVACVFSVLNRYVLAKVSYGVFYKMRPVLDQIADNDQLLWLVWLVRLRVWSVFSLLMRFDLLLVFFLVVAAGSLWFDNLRVYALWYSAFSMGIVFVRAFVRLYCVDLLRKVRSLSL